MKVVVKIDKDETIKIDVPEQDISAFKQIVQLYDKSIRSLKFVDAVVTYPYKHIVQALVDLRNN